MPDRLPWLQPPTNKAEFDELERNVAELCEEFYAKMLIVSAVTNHRLRNPKSGSKWAQKLASLRIDLRWYARNVTRPMAQSAAAAVAAGKAFRLAHTRFYEAQTNYRTDGTGSSGFDFS